MKKLIKTFFVCTCFLLGISNVSAYNKESVFQKTTESNGIIAGLTYGNSSPGTAYHNYLYKATTGDESYYAYCMDPYLDAFNTLKVDHILLGPESKTKAEDYGILVLLQNGYRVGDTNGKYTSEENFYTATSLAARAFVNGVLFQNYRVGNSKVLPALMGTLYTLTKDNATFAENFQKISNKEPKEILTHYGISTSSYPSFFGTEGGTKILDEMKDLLILAADATIKYKNGEIDVPKIDITVEGDGEPEATPSEDGTSATYKKLVIANVKLENFTDDGDFEYLGYSLPTGSGATVTEIGYSFTYSETKEDYTSPIPQNSNLLELLKTNDTNTIYFAYEVTVEVSIDENGQSSSADCLTKLGIKYHYKDTAVLNGAMLFPRDDAGHDYTNFQRFLIYSDLPVEGTYEVNVVMCEGICSPALNIPQICKDGEEIDENGNVTYDSREGYNNDSKTYNIKKCILKNSDFAGNSYKLVDSENAVRVASNPYCEVYCKEDYLFTVPYKRDTEAGRYFQISVALKGQQDCYSTKFDYTKYQKDIVDAQAAIADAFNTWRMYYELVKKYDWKQTTPMTCYTQSCNTTSDDPSTPEDESGCSTSTTSRIYAYKYEVDYSDKYFRYTKSEDGTQITILYNQPAPNANESFGKLPNPTEGSYCSGDSCRSHSTSCSTDFKSADTDYNEQKPTFESQLIAAKSDLDKKIELLKEKVDIFNSCLGSRSYEGYSTNYGSSAYWDMIYNYEPMISYSYDEPDPTDPAIPKWIESVKGLSCDDNKLCDVMIGTDQIVKAEVCDDDVPTCSGENNSKVCCSTASSVKDIDGDDHAVNTYCDGDIGLDYSCSGTSGNTPRYDVKEYFICKINETSGEYECNTNLDISRFNVTVEDYVHKIASSEGKYNTARVYYSYHDDGNIKIDVPGLTEVEDSEFKNNYDVVDGLPVGLDTPQGTYFYILSIDNIGSYYNHNELGRIFGDNTTSLTNVVRQEEVSTGTHEENTNTSNTNVKGNEYACSYTVSENTCEDADGKIHTRIECEDGEDWPKCKERLCPTRGNYCVKEAESYYSCPTQGYSESCVKYNSRAEALAAVNCAPGEDCPNNYNCCPNCSVLCVGKCVYVTENDIDGDGALKVEFRPISPANINPNERPLGYNWEPNAAKTNVLVAEKAYNTISEIEARNSGTTPETPVETQNPTEVPDYTLKVKLTPSLSTYVKEYNKSEVTNGNYNNDTLTCYDYDLSSYSDEDSCKGAGYTWETDKCVVTNIFCYSKFIDLLVENYPDNIDVPKRAEAKNSAYSNFNIYQLLAAGGAPSSGTPILTNDYWTIYSYTNLDINSDGIPDIGPSWK